MALVLSASQRLALKANLDYWRQREEEARKHYIAEDDALEAKIASKYNYLYMQLDERINAFYSRYATAEGIDMATAQQKVSKADIKAYSERAKQYVEAAARMRKAMDEGNFALAEQLKRYVFSDEAEEAMRLYNATMKINRLEMLKSQMGLDMVETFNGVQQDLGEGLDARTLEELERQAGILGETVSTTRHRIDAIVNASFNNATWSQRIWMYQTQMRDALGTLLTDGIIQGRNPVDLARDLRKIVGGSVKNTTRLLRTEMARVQTAAQENAYKEGGFEQYIFLALGTACPICRALDEQVFDIKFLDDNQFAPPVHPNCRCSTAAYADRAEMERELFGVEDKNSAELTTRRQERLAARRRVKREVDYSQMDSKQLKQYIEEHLKTSFEGLKGVNTDYLREAVKVIDQFEKKMGGRTIDGLSIRFGSVPNGAYAKYDDQTKTLILKKTGSIERFEEAQRNENARYRAKWKVGKDYHATETYSGTIWHELGHALDIESGQAFSKALSATSYLDAASVKVSAYAGTTQNVRVTKRSEAWAENFAAYMDGGKNKKRVPAEIADMIEEAFRKNTVQVVNSGNSGIIRASIESRNPAVGTPEGISLFGERLSKRQEVLLDQLQNYGDSYTFSKRAVSMRDLSALTAYTGHEFAAFTRKGKRLIVRGGQTDVPLTKTELKELANAGYRWSGHTHPGISSIVLPPSDKDRLTLTYFNQQYSVTYNASGQKYIFGRQKNEDLKER